MNRAELQQLSDERIEDARILFAGGQWSGSYYLAGYALECALKSCVLAYVERTGVIFIDKKFAEDCWTHDIERLVRQADLEIDRQKAMGNNEVLGGDWQFAKNWSESSRYRKSNQPEAERLLNALTDPIDGVLEWVRKYW